MSSVFLAPVLQPVTQSPHPVHASWWTPAALGPERNVTLTGVGYQTAPSAATRSASILASGGNEAG